MMIVVLGDEEGQIDHANLLVQARMQSGPLYERFVVGIKTRYEIHPLFAKCSQNILERIRIVICFVRFPVCQVGGRQFVAPRFEIVEASYAQSLQVQQVTGLFLN